MNRKNLTAAVLAGLAGIAGVASTAQAVNLNPDGLGEVLIYPFYTTNDGNQTLLTVVNTTGDAKAVKVRFLESYNSREVLDFNLYLSKYDVWVASIADGHDLLGDEALKDVPHLVIPDNSCTVPYLYADAYNEDLKAGVQQFLPYAYSGLNNDGGPNDPVDELGQPIPRATQGYFEVIEMGVMLGNDGKDTTPKRIDSRTAATHEVKTNEETGEKYPAPTDCNILVENWTEYKGTVTKPHPWAGWWREDSEYACDASKSLEENLAAGCGQNDGLDPDAGPSVASLGPNSGGLFGSAAVVNTAKGTMYSYDAKAVGGYDASRTGVHFIPGTIHPSLNDGDQDTAYVTVIDPDTGVPAVQTLSYTDPVRDRTVDAVSAVFMHDTLANVFTTEEGLHAATNWVITFPTKNWYVDPKQANLTITWIPDVNDPGCGGWTPAEPSPFPPGWQPGDTIPEGWELCKAVPDEKTSSVPPFTSIFSSAKGACEEVTIRSWDREESPTEPGGVIIPPIVSPAPPGTAPEGETPFELCYEVNVLKFGEKLVFGTDEALVRNVETDSETGWARLTFGGGDGLNSDGDPLCVSCDSSDMEQHIDKNDLRGLPVTGFSAEAYVNENVEGASVLANYSGLFGHKGSVRLCAAGDACASE